MARLCAYVHQRSVQFLNQWTQAMQPVAAVADDTYDQMMTERDKDR